MMSKPTYSLRKFLLTVALPIVAFWTVLFAFGYPLPSVDDLFFTGAAINLAKGGEFTNPYLEAWNAVFSSGKFYLQPPFHSYTLAGWLKLTGISTTSLRLFQFLCYNAFSLFCALVLRFYGFPRFTALCTAVFFAAWHCNPNPYYSPGFRQDALGMAYLALGLLLLTRDNWWRYFLGFGFIESAVLTSPITAGYGFAFGVAIPIINFIYRQQTKSNNRQYLFTRALALLAATVLVFILFLLCINFELRLFLSDFFLHASLRRYSPMFIFVALQGYGPILVLPSYILFLVLAVGVFFKIYSLTTERKILLIALSLGILLNFLLYPGAAWFSVFFCWLGIVNISSQIGWSSRKRIISLYAVSILIFLCTQSHNIISLLGREYVPESRYQEIKEFVLANPNRKYAIDDVAARFVFDYKFPKNTIDWNFLQPPIGAVPMSVKDKPKDVTWIVATSHLAFVFPEAVKQDYPRVEFLGRRFNSLPKKPFELTVIP